MNWTGGSLQRHSKNAHKGIIQRQKQHFAKVRTTLQNGPRSSPAPFRPSYLENEQLRGGKQSTLFELGVVRERAEHADRPEHSPARARREGHHSRVRIHEACEASEPRHRIHVNQNIASSASVSPVGASRKSRDAARPKKRPSSANEEDLLLKAKRQRLLEKQDWAGLVPPRPVHMHFKSRKEKDGIGKRRKVLGRLAIHHREPERFDGLAAGEEYVNQGQGAILRAEAKDIRIRIGTDALTSQTPMQQSDYARSHSSLGQASDPMLFDLKEVRDAPRATPSVRASRSRSPCAYTHAAIGPSRLVPPRNTLTGGQEVSRRRDIHLGSSRGISKGGQTLRDYSRDSIPANAAEPNEEVGFIFPLEQVAFDSAGGPFRFTFDKSSDYAGALGGAALQNDAANSSESEHAQATGPGPEQGRHETGHVRGGSSVVKTSMPASAIADDAPWKAFIAISEHSTNRSVSSSTSRPFLSHAQTEQQTAWSQHATLGDHTRISSSSCVSASLPSIRRADEHPMRSSRSQHGRAAISGRQSQGADESEKLWKTFVFSSGEDHASESMYGKSVRGGERSATIGTSNEASLPPSFAAAASTVSSPSVPTSRGSALALDLRRRDSTQHAANHAPSSFSPGTGPRYAGIPPMPRAYAEKTPRRMEDVTRKHRDRAHSTAGQSRIGDGARVTQTSLLNNVSDDSMHSISPRPQRGLDHALRTRNQSTRPDLEKVRDSSQHVEPSSIYDLPVSDSEV